MEQATTRVCECKQTYWPQQPPEPPPNIRRETLQKETHNQADVNDAVSQNPNGAHEPNDSGSEGFRQEQPAAGQTPVEQQDIEQPAVERPAVEQPAVEQQNFEQPAAEQPAVEQPASEDHGSNGTGPAQERAPLTKEPTDDPGSPANRMLPRDFVIPKVTDWTDPNSREAFEKLSNTRTWSTQKESNNIMHQLYMHEIDEQADSLRNAIAQDNIELIKKRLVQIIHLVNSWSST